MKNVIFQKKIFVKKLVDLVAKMDLAINSLRPQKIEKHRQALKKYTAVLTITQSSIVQIKEQLPPAGVLDVLFERIIEKGKLAETKPTIENREPYKEALDNFLKAYEESSNEEKDLWKDAFDESKMEYETITAKLEGVLAVKKRIDGFERRESAKVYCIVKGQNLDGSEWGRIDFVGMNYVMKNKDKVSRGVSDRNELPLVIKYYSYQDEKYTHIKDSNQLESMFDKQLMDVFTQSDCTSYELHKNFGRDYEYTPNLAEVVGKGEWYINWSKPIVPERVAKVIEVPDWNDYHFEDLFNEYLDDCEKGILTNTAGDALKEKMEEALDKQGGLIDELAAFHINQNDGDKDTQILIDVWNKRKQAFQEAMSTLKRDCIPAYSPPKPCQDFQAVYDEHVARCNADALPKRVGDDLKTQMQECIDDSKASLADMEVALAKYKSIPNWELDKDIKQKVDDLQLQIDNRKQEVEQQEKDLAGLPEECILPIPIEITFERMNNTISKKDDKQLRVISDFVKNNPNLKIKLIGNTAITKNSSLTAPLPENVVETEETDHIMPDDKLPLGLSQKDIDKIRKRPTYSKDLMMIRAERVKQLFIALGVNKDQIITEAGKNLGLPSSNQKVILEFY